MTKHFENCYIVFKRGQFDTTILNNSIVVILKGSISINGKYMGACSILKGTDIIGHSVFYITEDIRYVQYDLK